jgi:hypothetical protein
MMHEEKLKNFPFRLKEEKKINEKKIFAKKNLFLTITLLF